MRADWFETCPYGFCVSVFIFAARSHGLADVVGLWRLALNNPQSKLDCGFSSVCILYRRCFLFDFSQFMRAGRFETSPYNLCVLHLSESSLVSFVSLWLFFSMFLFSPLTRFPNKHTLVKTNTRNDSYK